MTFEARDSAAKVVPARFKMSTTGPPSSAAPCGYAAHGNRSVHGSLRTSGSQTTSIHPHSHHVHSQTDRHALTQSFMQFSRGLAMESHSRTISPQSSVSKSPSAPNLVERGKVSPEQTSPTNPKNVLPEKASPKSSRRTFAACALLNPGLLHRHAVSVDETAATYRHESLQGSGSQGSMALDLHLDYPVTLRVRDRRRNPLRRQQRVEEDAHNDSSRRSSHSCSPRLSLRHHRDVRDVHMASMSSGGSAHQLPTHFCSSGRRRSSNASDCTHRSRMRRRECHHTRGRLERAISSDSRLTGAIPKCHHHHYTPQTSTEQEAPESKSDTDIHHARHAQTHANVHNR